jgi:hypothetical protein
MWQSIKEPRGIISLSLSRWRETKRICGMVPYSCIHAAACCSQEELIRSVSEARGGGVKKRGRGFTLRQTGHVGDTTAVSFADGFTDNFFVASSAPSREISLYHAIYEVRQSRSSTLSTRRNVRALARASAYARELPFFFFPSDAPP